MPKPSDPARPSKAPTYLTVIGLTLTAVGIVIAAVMFIGALPGGLTASEAALPVTVGLIWILFGGCTILVGSALRQRARKQAERHPSPELHPSSTVGEMGTGCATCETALVRNAGRPPHDVDIAKTSAALEERVDDGRMRYLRGDVPLADMLALAQSDLKYTIVSFLHCEECGRTRFWGLCIRGAPSYKVVDAEAPSTWPWDAVPDRLRWAP